MTEAGELLALGREPTAEEIANLRRELTALLAWQRDLKRFPAVRAGLDATPFVSIYARGRVLGCFGSTEGAARERLGRAFLRAVEDSRFGGVDASTRPALAAQISYPADLRRVAPEEAAEAIELGREGVFLRATGGRASVVLPHVARDMRFGAKDMIALAARKAGIALAPGAPPMGCRIELFTTIDVTARSEKAPQARRSEEASRCDLAADWLARLVDAEGRVAFGVDPRTGARVEVGDVMHHGRAASVVAALAQHGGHEAVVARARRRLEIDVRAGLAGQSVPGFPAHRTVIGGTIALACLAGVALTAELDAFAKANPAIFQLDPWHSAQIAAALGRARPRDAGRDRFTAELVKVCARDLTRRPFAPWLSLAAHAVRDVETARRVDAGLVASIRRRAPHAGGAAETGGRGEGQSAIPEIAMTAIAIEALRGSKVKGAARAVADGQAFLTRWQLVGDALGAAYDVAAARGAFPISPVFDALRCDVTAHALAALLPCS